jgi:hypothetical protein
LFSSPCETDGGGYKTFTCKGKWSASSSVFNADWRHDVIDKEQAACNLGAVGKSRGTS